MKISTPVVDSFGVVVSAVEAELLTYLQTVNSTISQVHYLYGHPLEIINTLVAMKQPQTEQYKKFPLIALFMDFQESKGVDPSNEGRVKLQVIIAHSANATDKAKTRYTKSFKPILYPIYEALIRQLKASQAFSTGPTIRHTKIDRPFWGKEGLYGNTASIATDELDCIEIKDLELTLRTQLCSAVNKPFSNF